MTILPLAYLPSVEWFARALRGDCVIDVGEHFIKRSERNRARILAADGPMSLSVQVAHADRPRQPMHSVRVDYSKRWQHQHWGAITAAYKGSPYFDHYAPAFEPFYRETYRPERLAEWNLALVERLCALLGIPVPPVAEQYVGAAAGDTDLRPKRRPGLPDGQGKGPAFVAEPYVQVFADRLPFAANLSVADLLFAEGPAAVSVLGRCLRGA